MQFPLLTTNRMSGCSSRPFVTSMKFDTTGDPQKVLRREISDLDLKAIGSYVKIKFLVSPINPSDINMVQGVYGVVAKLPAIAGNEGVAEVVEVGPDVVNLTVGQWVIPFRSGFGCWRDYAVAREEELIQIANDIPAAYAATLSVNPATAYRLLRDFEVLRPGDVLIQNGANSMVGLAVIQMARLMGVKTINVIRSDRPRAKELLNVLSNLGGDINITDDLLNTAAFRKILASFPPCKLAFNCVGGKATTEMIRCLAPGATVVTYGGMSKKPLTVPVDLLIHNQYKLRGFWMAEWYETYGSLEKANMMEAIVNMVRLKQLSLFYETFGFDDFDAALSRSLEPFRFRKVILCFDHSDNLLVHNAEKEEILKTFEGT